MTNKVQIFEQLEQILKQRKSADVDTSYVASLYASGLDVILKKIGEEATEVIIAAKSQQKQQIIYEVADLWFHTMVLLAQQNISIKEITEELSERFGSSGLIKKSSKNKA